MSSTWRGQLRRSTSALRRPAQRAPLWAARHGLHTRRAIAIDLPVQTQHRLRVKMSAGASRPPLLQIERRPLGEVLEFLRVIWQVDHALQRTSKQMASTLGVTGPQRLVLRIVGRFPGIPAGQLAKVLHLHPSTLTGVLKRLERQGLLRRRSDPHDARRSLLRLTDRGRAFDVEASGTVEAHVASVLARAPAQQVRGARELLAEIAAALSESVDAPRPKRLAPVKRALAARRKRAASISFARKRSR